MHHDTHPIAPPPRLTLGAAGVAGPALLVLGGAATLAWSLNAGHLAEAWGGYLIGVFYFLELALFGTLWVSIQYLTKSYWSVPLRRLAEAMTGWLAPAAALALTVALGAATLYPWSHHEAVLADELLSHKSSFLNIRTFLVVIGVAFLGYLLLTRLLLGNSRKQDETGSVRHTQANWRWGAVFILFFAPSFSLVSYVLLMSLEPHWFSTMFAVLCFTDTMQTGLAWLALATSVLMLRGKLAGYVDENHLHDVTKMMYAFTGFWAYIYFCQFLLIWYANLPEETTYFITRWSHGWAGWLIALPVFKFLIPFIYLTPRDRKRDPRKVAVMASLLLAAQFLELYLMVAPALGGHGPEGHAAEAHLPLVEGGIFLGLLGAFYLVFRWVLSRQSPVPLKDPLIGQAMHHHI